MPAQGLDPARLDSIPAGPDVEVADPGLLSPDQYAHVAVTTASYKPTEYGNAQRLAVLFGEDVRWVPDEKRWYLWDGRQWSPDRDGGMMRRAKTVARLLWHELPHVDGVDRPRWTSHAKHSESKRGLQAMIDVAASEKKSLPSGEVFTLTCPVDDFDQDRSLLNCPNGTLDLLTGELRGHRREDMQRRCTAVPYIRGSRSAEWERFLETTTGGDQELVAYLQLLAGGSLLGDNRHDLVPVIYGPPGSGKSTFIQALLAPLGRGYADTANLETFAERRATSAARDDLARLEGLRLVACLEGERNHSLAAGLIKQISGGDSVSARRLYMATRTWTPEMTVWMAVNEPPRIHHDEEGMWRRIKGIPFENQVVRIDVGLRERLSDPDTTGIAVLTWAVEGAVRLANMTDPLEDPLSVVQATEEYREQVPDGLDCWLNECCTPAGEDATTSVESLRDSYLRWCAANNQQELNVKAWGTSMTKRFNKGRTSRVRFYRGILL